MTDTQAGDYAIGMIKIDGLEPTDEFKQFIEKEKRGEVTMDDLKRFLDESACDSGCSFETLDVSSSIRADKRE